MTHFRTRLLIRAEEGAVFRALTADVQAWWSQAYQGSACTVGDRFTVRFDRTFKTFEVVELTAGKRVVWRCIESFLDVDALRDKAEWNGTVIVWDILPKEDAVVLDVAHEGLTPAIGCYDACTQGWEYFLHKSLLPYLATGHGAPYGGGA